MSLVQSTQTPASLFLRAGASALFVLFLTTVHHVYGAVIYETPWRLHIVFISIPFALLIAGALIAGRWIADPKWARIATWVAIATILIFPVAMIGIYEGGYNHVVKNLLYFGVGEHALAGMCEPGVCELPNSFFFEATGVAQFGAGIYAAFQAIRLFRHSR